MPKQLTDTEIAIRVVPTHLRWPERGTTVVSSKLHDAVDALHALARTVDENCAAAEGNRDLSPDAIRRQRAAIGGQALTELVSFRPFQIAEKVVTENIEFLENSQAPHLEKARLSKALQELREGIAATKRMLLERCKLREDSEGKFRSI